MLATVGDVCVNVNQRKIEFVPNQEFDSATESEINNFDLELYVDDDEYNAPSDPEFFLLSVDQLRILSPEGERFLFKRLNFLRFRAHALQATLRSGKRSKKTEEEILRLLDEAEQTRGKIAVANFRLVHSIVRRLAKSRDEIEEFAAESNTILLKAIDKFDYSRGYRFSTYATHSVRRHLRKLIQRKSRNRENEQVLECFDQLESSTKHLSKVSEQRLIDTVKTIVDSFDKVLEPREKFIVMARYGLDGMGQGKSMKLIGDELGLSKERVRQLLQLSLEKLAAIAKPLDLVLEERG